MRDIEQGREGLMFSLVGAQEIKIVWIVTSSLYFILEFFTVRYSWTKY